MKSILAEYCFIILGFICNTQVNKHHPMVRNNHIRLQISLVVVSLHHRKLPTQDTIVEDNHPIQVVMYHHKWIQTTALQLHRLVRPSRKWRSKYLAGSIDQGPNTLYGLKTSYILKVAKYFVNF